MPRIESLLYKNKLILLLLVILLSLLLLGLYVGETKSKTDTEQTSRC